MLIKAKFNLCLKFACRETPQSARQGGGTFGGPPETLRCVAKAPSGQCIFRAATEFGKTFSMPRGHHGWRSPRRSYVREGTRLVAELKGKKISMRTSFGGHTMQAQELAGKTFSRP